MLRKFPGKFDDGIAVRCGQTGIDDFDCFSGKCELQPLLQHS